MIIDTHAHLDDVQYADDLDEVVSRARAAGVGKVLLAGVSMLEMDKVLEVEGRYPGFCHAMIGVHPEMASGDVKREMELFDREVDRRSYIAIGEIGMDLHFDATTRDEQEKLFSHQMAAAVERGLPVSIHSRDAFQATVDVIKQFDRNRVRGVWHCFSMAPENARTIMSLGDFYFGIGGVATFKNAKFAERLPEIPIDRIILETDCPYLAPTPLRGKRNEPSYLTYVAEKLAGLYGLSAEEVCDITTNNAERLFF